MYRICMCVNMYVKYIYTCLHICIYICIYTYITAITDWNTRPNQEVLHSICHIIFIRYRLQGQIIFHRLIPVSFQRLPWWVYIYQGKFIPFNITHVATAPYLVTVHLEEFVVDNGNTQFIAFLLTDPHLLESDDRTVFKMENTCQQKKLWPYSITLGSLLWFSCCGSSSSIQLLCLP